MSRPRRQSLTATLTASTASVLLVGVASGSPLPPIYVPDLEPPNPVAGECYARVEIPAQYEETTQQMMTREGHQRLMVQQPQLESRVERVMVKEPSVRYVVRQPTYRTVQETIMTRPAYDKLSVSDPVFQTVTETVQLGQSRLVWKRGNPAKLRAEGYIIHSTADAGSGGKGYASTTEYARTGGQRCLDDCVIWCLVEQPGESVTVNRQVMSQPGQVRRTPVPAKYETITKQVVADPGGVEKVQVPAEYRNIQVEKLVSPGATASINVSPEYSPMPGRRLVSSARYEWRRIECKPGVQTHTHARPPLASSLAGSGQTIRSHSWRPAQTTTQYRTRTTTTTTQSPSTSSYQGTVGRVETTSPTITYSGPAYSRTYTPQTYSTTPVERTHGTPDPTYQGPAYAIPPDGASHPYAVQPGEPRRPGRLRRAFETRNGASR